MAGERPESQSLSQAPLLNLINVASRLYAAQASSNGGTSAERRLETAFVTASLTSAAVAAWNSDHKSAIVPVTKGAAALVPSSVTGSEPGPRLVMLTPGALRPRRPIEPLRFEWLAGRPVSSHATTEMTEA